MRWLALLLLAVPALSQDPQDDQIDTDDLNPDTIKKLQKAEQAKDWKALWNLYEQILKKDSQKLAPHPERNDGRIGVVEYLLDRYSKLPKEALEIYRDDNDGRAREAFAQAFDSGEPSKVHRAIDQFFFASGTDEILDRTAGRYFDRCRFTSAVFFWNRLLRYYPDSGIPKPVTAARIAVACACDLDASGLDRIRSWVKTAGLDGEILVGTEKTSLSRFLEGLRVEEAAVVRALPKLPSVPEGANRFARRITGVRNEIKRWSYDFGQDKSESSKVDAPERLIIRRGGRWEGGPIEVGKEFPYLPAYGRIGTREYVVATNGYRVVAFNAAAVRGESSNRGIYWKYPESGPIAHPPVPSQYSGQLGCTAPFIGVAIDGEHAFATLYSERNRREPNVNNTDVFDGPTRLVCIHIPSARVVWDTDRLETEFKKLEFYDRNFAFSGPPIVRGRNVYVGIGTSPFEEQRSYVACLDRESGRPVWFTFLSAVNGGGRNPWAGNGAKSIAYLTTLAEQAGTLYVATNLGAVAAVQGVDGSVLWLTTYKRAFQRQNWEVYQPQSIRPANPPLLNRGVLYVLAQDANEMLAFDAQGGAKTEIPPIRVRDSELQWKNVSHLIGVVQDWMILGGAESYVILLQGFKAYSLIGINTSRCGRGALEGEAAYFPTYDDAGGGLAVFHGVNSWGRLNQANQARWKGKDEFGNLLVAGDFLVVASDKITVYTDTETLRKEYSLRVKQSPPQVATLLEYATVMRENDRLPEAAESYLEFVRVAEGDERYGAKVGEVKRELFAIFTKRGDDAVKSADRDAARKALSFYLTARDFAYDSAAATETGRKIAECREKLGQWDEAVREYQKLIEDGRTRTYRPEGSNVVETLWDHARRKIDAIVAQQKEAYRDIEREAGEALRKLADGDVEALKRLRELYPNSKAAREAWKKLFDGSLEKKLWNRARGLLEEFKSWYGGESGFEQQRTTVDLLEKIGDSERLLHELERLRDRFGDVRLETETVREFAERKIRELGQKPRPDDGSGVADPMVKLGEMDAVVGPQGVSGVAVGYLPLAPRGILPADFPTAYELFERGSSVELWDLTEKRRVWACAHPGGYVGLVVGEPKEGVGVEVVEVRAGSPAEKAGLASGDVLVEIDGRAATMEEYEKTLLRRDPPKHFGVKVRRAANVLEISCEVAPWPRELRPAIVGSTFTTEGELAVAWEDGVAAIELESGRVLWFSWAVRPRFCASGLHSTDGRIFLYETFRPERSCRPLRVFPAPPKDRPLLEPEEANTRLVCLEDFSGRVRWVKLLEMLSNGQGASALSFYSTYLSETMAIVESRTQGGHPEWVLSVVNVSDGRPVQTGTKSVSLATNQPVYTVDLESGVLYYVDVRDPNNRALRSVSIDPSRESKPIDIALQGKYMDAASSVCRLAANPEYLCLLVPPGSAESPYRIWVFRAKDGKEFLSLSLPAENRTLPPAECPDPEIDSDGTLYVYNVAKKTGQGKAAMPAFLTAYRLGAEVARRLAWEAVAPSVAGRAAFRLETRMRNFVALYAPHGVVPRESGEGPVAAVYAREGGGYLRMLFTEVSAVEGIDPVVFRRGRLYVNTRTGLQIYGNP